MKNIPKPKPTLLTWHDFLVPTGFSIVAENLLDGLEKDFDIEVCAINYPGGEKYDTSKYFVHPNIGKDDPLNVQTLYKRAHKGQPDLIFLFQDIFNIDRVVAKLKELSPNSKIVSYFPTDGMPSSAIYDDIFKHSDYLIAYTHWAKKVLETTSKIEKPLEVLYHGVNQNDFFPIPDAGIEKLKESIGWKDKFVMTLVAKYQPRKQIETTIRVYSMFTKGYKECQDCSHKMPITQSICELCMGEDLKEEGTPKDDTVLYLHTMIENPKYGGAPTHNLSVKAENCGFTEEDISQKGLIAFNMEDLSNVGLHILNQVYNSSNLHVTSTVGEGCGLPILESMATGTPTLAPKHSAIPEMMGSTGRMIKNKAVFSLPMDNGHFRPILDESDYLDGMEEYYAKWKKSESSITKEPGLIVRAQEKFSWDDKRKKLKKIFSEVLPT